MCFCVVFAESKVPAVDQNDSEARQAMAGAEEARSQWTQSSLRQAISQYEKAALLWISASDFTSASQATLKSGDLYFLFSDYGEALERYQSAQALAKKARDWLAEANALSRMGRVESDLGNHKLAQEHITRALDLFKQHEVDRSEITVSGYVDALSNSAEVIYATGDFVKAREQLNTALELSRGNPGAAARIHLLNGYIAGSLGELEKAVTEIFLARELYREASDKVGEAKASTTLGLSHSHKGDNNRARELHRGALEIFRAVGDRHSEAVSHNALGGTYEREGAYSLALNHYQQAASIFETIGSKDGMSVAVFQIARTHDASGNRDQALTFYNRSLQLSRAAGKVRSEANALNEIANIYAAQGRYELASDQYQKILKFYESIGDLRDQAITLNAYGDFLLRSRQGQKALDALLRALPLSEKVDDKAILITTLYNLARANLYVGSAEAAYSSIQRSLAIIEDQRANVASPDFRASYFSGVRKHYELCIEIMVQLDRLGLGRGFAAEALLVSEKGRARLILDLVRESGAGLRQGAAQKLLEREHELRELFRLRAMYRMDLVLSKKDSSEIGEIDNQLAQLRAEYQDIQAQLRQQNPRLFSLEQTAPLSLQQIQSELRDGDTMLLEYALGEQQSHLWAVTSNSIEHHNLPARKEIEDAAREVYRLTTARQGSGDANYQTNIDAADNAYMETATKLSQMLLGPVAERLGNKRLLVVTEGALQHISIEALPLPVTKTSESASGAFVIDKHEVVILPSFSTLVAIRNSRNRASSPGKLVAVIADPVFSNSDDRVKSEAGMSAVASAATDKKSDPQTRDAGLARLTYASEEADAISAVAPWGTTMVAKGFDANREIAMSSDVGQYQILHFATHGFLDSEQPELSGIVLSSMDPDGQVKSGLMPLHDIYSLDLSAQLTVLSACQTALGKDIKGEGLVGLTHSFISAGSNSVAASLWKVDDRATAVLMADFYDAMLQQGMPPAAALRSAKLKMMKDERRRAPYYWAGFVLQGEYRNRIVVTRHTWLRSGLILSGLLVLITAALFVFKKRWSRYLPSRST